MSKDQLKPHKPLILWAESPDEARGFLKKCEESMISLPIELIYVAKMSGKSRANNYIVGQYYVTSNDEHVDAYESVITAPSSIVELVQWCTCDIMLSKGEIPLAVLEDTTHIVRMNLFQRIPRIAKAAILGVPSIVLQGTQGINLSMRGDRWALYRYLQVFHSLSTQYPDFPPLPFYYLPEAKDAEIAQLSALNYLKNIFENNQKELQLTQEKVLSDLRNVIKNGLNNKVEIAPQIPSIQVKDEEVIVKIGANPDKASWKTKGSGQMDPYLGMIVAAKYNYCFDAQGTKVKPLIVEFTNLPPDFFFFKDWQKSNSLYKRLVFELADKVIFCG